MGRRDKDDGDWAEDGQPVIRGWMKGRAGRAPRGRLPDSNPHGFGQARIRGGPTRGTSYTGNDRRGGWFFRGPRG
jgi:hypothetical protein